jgi:hypothetical protein
VMIVTGHSGRRADPWKASVKPEKSGGIVPKKTSPLSAKRGGNYSDTHGRHGNAKHVAGSTRNSELNNLYHRLAIRAENYSMFPTSQAWS